MVALFSQGFLFKRAPESDATTVSAVCSYGGYGSCCTEVGLSVLTALRVAFPQLLREKQYEFFGGFTVMSAALQKAL